MQSALFKLKIKEEVQHLFRRKIIWLISPQNMSMYEPRPVETVEVFERKLATLDVVYCTFAAVQ